MKGLELFLAHVLSLLYLRNGFLYGLTHCQRDRIDSLPEVLLPHDAPKRGVFWIPGEGNKFYDLPAFTKVRSVLGRTVGTNVTFQPVGK